MKGAYELTVQNKRIHYQFTIKRNITVIRGDSATGKTTLLELSGGVKTLILMKYDDSGNIFNATAWW